MLAKKTALFMYAVVVVPLCRYTCAPGLLLTSTVPVSQVSQLCRGLLQPDPSKRHGASEGQSIVSWFVSRLETADRQGANESIAAATSRSSCKTSGPPMASCETGDAHMRAGGASVGRRERNGSAIGPVDIAIRSLPLGGIQVFKECGADARKGKWEDGGCPERASLSLDAAARRTTSEERRHLEEPDELVR